MLDGSEQKCDLLKFKSVARGDICEIDQYGTKIVS